MVELLLGHGASPHATTNDGNTPLSLGFRGPGLTVSEDTQYRVADLLQIAMTTNKRSKLKQLSSFMHAGSNKSKDAAERNKAWHTAELAAGLYTVDSSESYDNNDS